MQEESQVLLGNTGLLAESLPVTIAALVQGDDEVKDGLGLRGHLSQSDALAGKRSSGPSVSDEGPVSTRKPEEVIPWGHPRAGCPRGRVPGGGRQWAQASVEQTHLLMWWAYRFCLSVRASKCLAISRRTTVGGESAR